MLYFTANIFAAATYITSNKSKLGFIKKHKHYAYLQLIFYQKLFTKDIKNAKQQGLGLVDQESWKYKGVECKGLKVS